MREIEAIRAPQNESFIDVHHDHFNHDSDWVKKKAKKMSKKQVLCGLGTIVGAITIIVVIVFLAVQNGTEEESVLQIDLELKMYETEKPTNAETTPKTGNTPKQGNTPKPGDIPKPSEIQGVSVSSCQIWVLSDIQTICPVEAESMMTMFL